MSDHIYEEQQIEAIKAWWQKRGKLVVGLAVVLVAAIYGTKAWIAHKDAYFEKASEYYETMLLTKRQNDSDAFKVQAQHLIDNFADSRYADFAQLMLAKQAVEANQLDEAEQALKWILTESDSDNLQHIARFRLARVHVAQKKFEQVLTLFKGVDFGAYAPIYHEAEGDAYLGLGDMDNARSAYQLAIAELGSDASLNPLLQMKLDDLAVAPSVGDKTDSQNS